MFEKCWLIKYPRREMLGLEIPLILTQNNHHAQSHWHGGQSDFSGTQMWKNTSFWAGFGVFEVDKLWYCLWYFFLLQMHIHHIMPLSFSCFLSIWLWLSVFLSRSSPTPKTPWAWAARSLRAALVSSATCPQMMYLCTSTTPRSLTQDAMPARS